MLCLHYSHLFGTESNRLTEHAKEISVPISDQTLWGIGLIERDTSCMAQDAKQTSGITFVYTPRETEPGSETLNCLATDEPALHRSPGSGDLRRGPKALGDPDEETQPPPRSRPPGSGGAVPPGHQTPAQLSQ
ncbi:hypothetical protein NDU88_005412 [Pleurodeles waltl]|uniref:Uncharacterized protein n=1 Tax=Pleurodeles waltl TaxID=8319 RepID=A0AAV7NRG1_PLEWA|nr:hypothetical protein NDU88_005412 [Pleurodeles waltl]